MANEELPHTGKVLVGVGKLDEVLGVYESVSRLLNQMIAELEAGDQDALKKVQTQLQHLQNAYFIVQKTQDKIHEQNTASLGLDEVDFDAVRDSIGSRLDKLRASRNSG